MEARDRQVKFYPMPESQLALNAGGGRRGGGGANGGGTGVAASSDTPKRPPTLTEQFNQAAQDMKPPGGGGRASSKAEMEMLGKKRSQPRMNCSYSPLGTVTNSINKERDRMISQRVQEIKERLAAQKGIHKQFNQRAKKPTLTQKFNQASLGRGM